MRLEQLESGFRYFEVVTAGIPREASGDLITCRWIQPLLVRVRYDYNDDIDQLETAITEDVIAIIKALRSPSNWNQGSSGLTSVRILEEDIEPEPIGEEERPIAVIVPIPITITYRDC